ncbi:ABC transporter ATP-binding protein [Nocardiopsis algeriensis]|uniref:Oligopeptide/dipeptide ABC transporter ATP-binding protein n=1 Tax=Nocardiopsis algeriensis TaxID=1478215 RepID=A0A841ILD8_9ACTN|nr:ABC transporter ATP-binding protein [Nocardiopsis algeriensis]MBB6119547.1 oligopeptide/dipeptide ABC transporter ATP-binding protein [Nocardiopsis algeriensis]
MSDTPDILRLDRVGVGLRTPGGTADLLRNVSFSVARGEIVALAGESGSGKSTALLAVLRLLAPGAQVSGSILVDGKDIAPLRGRELRAFRSRTARMVFQDPWRALHPMHSIGRQLTESARAADPTLSKEAARTLAGDMLARVGIPDPGTRLRSYPHEVSGGQLQRIVIAMALVASPSLLLCDEPTTALDVTTQAQILELLQELNRDLGITVVLATHDLDVIADIADRLVVMYAGSVAEEGPTGQVMARPEHPYTRSLLQAAPGRRPGERLRAIAGRPPSPLEVIEGCPFAARCEHRTSICATAPNTTVPIAGEPGRRSACVRVTAGTAPPSAERRSG